MDIKCLCIQENEETARALVDLLELKDTEGLEEKAELSDQDKESEDDTTDTDQLLRDMSAAEKMAAEELEEEETEDGTIDTDKLLKDMSTAEKLDTETVKGKCPKKTLGSTIRTRSKGGSKIQWSKSLNPDMPIS